MKKTYLVLAIFVNLTYANTLKEQYNDIVLQANYNQLPFHSADGAVEVMFDQLKNNDNNRNVSSGYISEIKLCNALCKTYKFEPNHIVVLNPNELEYNLFTQKLDNNITINGFLCKNTSGMTCHSYITIEKEFNHKPDALEVYYLDPATTTVSVKRKY